jgi:hypothetical protein
LRTRITQRRARGWRQLCQQQQQPPHLADLPVLIYKFRDKEKKQAKRRDREREDDVGEMLLTKALYPQSSWAFFFVVVVGLIYLLGRASKPVSISINSYFSQSTIHNSIITPLSTYMWPFFFIFLCCAVLCVCPHFTIPHSCPVLQRSIRLYRYRGA